MKTNSSGVIAIIVAICALPFSTASAASRNSSDLLQYIPADTPYVFVSTSPMPEEMADKFEPTIDGILQACTAASLSLLGQLFSWTQCRAMVR